MNEKKLHIVSFDVPYPPNYGGVIDVYYKLLQLKKLGVKIHLHVFCYGRTVSDHLNEVCEKVYSYPRKQHAWYLFSPVPFIVKSRTSHQLVKNLMQEHDNAPILLEGLHTTSVIADNQLISRRAICRTANIEHHYYAALAKAEKRWFRKMFLFLESRKLKRWEKVLSFAAAIVSVSYADHHYFKKQYPMVKGEVLPVFHPFEYCTCMEGHGSFVLYHGNLSVPENFLVATELTSLLGDKADIALVVAGLLPPLFLKKHIERFSNATLIDSPSEEALQKLIQQAHIHLMFTHQATGMKLKLINALFNGRYIMANEEMLSGTALQKACEVVPLDEMLPQRIKLLMKKPFLQQQIAEREQLITEELSNRRHAKKLVSIIFPDGV